MAPLQPSPSQLTTTSYKTIGARARGALGYEAGLSQGTCFFRGLLRCGRRVLATAAGPAARCGRRRRRATPPGGTAGRAAASAPGERRAANAPTGVDDGLVAESRRRL